MRWTADGSQKSAPIRRTAGRPAAAQADHVRDRMFGPLDVGALVQGRYMQIFDGHAMQREIAFIDEIFECSASTLDEMQRS